MFREGRDGWIGVDRGAGAVKLAQLRRAGDGVRVTVAAMTPRWKDDGDASLADSQCCRREVDSIRALVGSWRSRHAAATTSMAACTLSTTDDDVAASDAAVCADSWQVGESDRYILSMPEREVSSLCGGLRLSGLQCRVIDGAPLAIARAMRLAPEGAGNALVAGLDLGVAGATFVAAKGGRAVYARKLTGCGFGRVFESIAEELGLTASEAETLVRRHGVASTRLDGGVAWSVSEALSHATAPIVQEVRRTLTHLGAKLKTKGPDRLWGFGVGATPPGLMKKLGERVGIDAEPWRAESIDFEQATDAPPCLFGPAVALSALAWEA